MGSACSGNTSRKNPCTDPVSSDCVIWQGGSIPLLGICCGDTITEVEESIIDKLSSVLNGTGIDLSAIDLTNALFLTTLLGSKNKNLVNLIQILVDSDTDLRTLVEQIQESLKPTGDNFAYQLKCLDTSCCPNQTLTRDQVIQMLIDKFCDIQTELDNLEKITSNINDTISNTIGNVLSKAISSCGSNGIVTSGSGLDTKIVFTGLPPIFSAIAYYGPLEWFDSSGKGLQGTPACGWAQLNGNNNMPDWRGYSLIGANIGIPGGALDARVDPNKINQPGSSLAYKQKYGEMFHLNTIPEMPAHGHIVNDPTHDHPQFYHPFKRNFGGRSNDDIVFEDTDKSYNKTNAEDPGKPFIGKSATGITLNNTGGNQPHNNIPPVVSVIWIGPLQ